MLPCVLQWTIIVVVMMETVSFFTRMKIWITFETVYDKLKLKVRA